MASIEQDRFWGEFAPFGVANMMDVSPTMVLATRGQVAVTNWTIKGIRGTEADPEYLKFTKFMKTDLLAFWEDFNPKEVER